MSVTEHAGKVAGTAVEAMRSTPLAIALLVVNLGFLIFSGWVLHMVAANSDARNKTQMELIADLVKDIGTCRQTTDLGPPNCARDVPGACFGDDLAASVDAP